MFSALKRKLLTKRRRWLVPAVDSPPGSRDHFVVTVPCVICGRPHAMGHSRGRLAMVECPEHRDPVGELRRHLVIEPPVNYGSRMIESIKFSDQD
jgi:hypothetical protein